MSDRTIGRIITGVFVGIIVTIALVVVVAVLGIIGAATWAVTP